MLADMFEYSKEVSEESKLREFASEFEVKSTLRHAIGNMEIEP